jgi:hypothetical protein
MDELVRQKLLASLLCAHLDNIPDLPQDTCDLPIFLSHRLMNDVDRRSAFPVRVRG